MTSLLEKTHRSTSPGCLHSLVAEELGRFEVAVPDDVPAFLLAANEALQKDLRSLARAHLDQGREQVEALLSLHPERSDIMFILGKLWYDLEELSQAETWFQRILEIEPHAHVYYLLSDMMLRNRSRMATPFNRDTGPDSRHAFSRSRMPRATLRRSVSSTSASAA